MFACRVTRIRCANSLRLDAGDDDAKNDFTRIMALKVHKKCSTVGGPIKGPIYFVISEVWSLKFRKSLNFLKNFVSIFSEFLRTKRVLFTLF